LRLAAALLATIALGLAGCSGGDDDTVPTSTSVPRQTEFTGPIPVPTATVGPATTVGPALTTTPVDTQPITPTQPSLTPLPPDPGAPTTAGPPCDAATLFAVLQARDEPLPPGTGADTPACAGGWATMVIGAPGQDRALAVFESAGVWVVRNVGTDAVCTDGGVPPQLYDALGCALWETS
jgi:hypothetical protein